MTAKEEVFRGWTINPKTGKWSPTSIRPMQLNYTSNVTDLADDTVLFETNFDFSEIEHQFAIDGINHHKLYIHPPYDGPRIHPEMKTYCSARIVRRGREIYIDQKQLVATPEFFNKIRNILLTEQNSTLTEQDSTLTAGIEIVKALNEYGWYVPTHYILGGSYRAVEVGEAREAEEITNKLKDALEDLYSGFSLLKIWRRIITFITLKGAEISSVGANGAVEIENFKKNVKNDENWEVIQYLDFYPTLSLLPSEVLDGCIMILGNPDLHEHQNYIYIDHYAWTTKYKIEDLYFN